MATSTEVQSSTDQINNINARVRLSEERMVDLRKHLQLVETNMLALQKKTASDAKNLNSEVSTLKRQVAQVEDRITTLLKELTLLAQKEDVDILKKYIELWNPVKFVTVEQVERMIEEEKDELPL